MKSEKSPLWEKNIIFLLSPIVSKRVIVWCSGGPDSMWLLDMVRVFYVESARKNLIVAHIQHWLRESAERDQEIVQEYCRKYHLLYECLRVDIKKEAKKTKTSLEECGRNTRKKWLDELRIKHQADSILTAHHADDQAETILYRITKWTSITGLSGISQFSGYYFRPLLTLSKKDIVEYNTIHSVPSGYDETNDDTSIPRNLLRQTILPQLQSINPEVAKALSRLSESAQELKSSFDCYFAEIITQKEFSYDWYQTLPLGFQHELLRCFYETANGSTHGLSLSLLLELDKFLSTRTGGKKELWKKWLVKKQGTIYLT